MEMTIREDCGNSPRMAIVADLVTAWAAGEEHAVREWLRDDAEWSHVRDATKTARICEVRTYLQLAVTGP